MSTKLILEEMRAEMEQKKKAREESFQPKKMEWSEEKKKHKKRKKEKKHKRERRRRSDSSDPDSAEGGVSPQHSRDASPVAASSTGHIQQLEASPEQQPQQRDDWMTSPGLFPCFTRNELRQQKAAAEGKKPKIDQLTLDRPGQSSRELNPYWKGGGTGLPQTDGEEEEKRKAGVGDKGAGWLRRAYQRVQEQAERESRSMEEVAAERWGSLDRLKKLLAEAEGSGGQRYADRPSWHNQRNNKPTRSSAHYPRNDRSSRYSESHKSDHREERFQFLKPDENRESQTGEHHRRRRDDPGQRWRKKESSDHHQEDDNGGGRRQTWRKESPDHHQEDDNGGGRRQTWRKESPDHHQEDGNGGGRRQTWRKESPDTHRGKELVASKETRKPRRGSPESHKFDDNRKDSNRHHVTSDRIPESSSEVALKSASPVSNACVLTDKEMNELGAKIVKAELLGNDALASQLKKRLEDARKARGTQGGQQEVILIRGGLEAAEPQSSGRRRPKVQTHQDGQRLRYFPDDDRYSLHQMFQREKMTTAEDQNAEFAAMVGKGRFKIDGDHTFDDEVISRVAGKSTAAKEMERAKSEAIRKHQTLESCTLCLENPRLQRHMIVSMGKLSYLTLPMHESLTDGHCFLIASSHASCAVQLDEDVWSEIRQFRASLVHMFSTRDLDVIFFETVPSLRHHPHMKLQCVPVPLETGSMAPIYFKKAIMECEGEWAMNKKLVDLKGRDVRRAIPKGLPYFWVGFGMEEGFAHVVEDEKDFPANFAEEVIGGMLDLEPHKWRKPRRERFEEQSKKVMEFSSWWEPHDWAKAKMDTS